MKLALDAARRDLQEKSVLDTTPVTAAIAAMIRTGTTEQQLLAAIATAFPDLARAEFVAALQEATEAAEKRAAKKH